MRAPQRPDAAAASRRGAGRDGRRCSRRFRALQAQDPAFVAPEPALAAFLDERFLASSAAGLLGMGDALLAEPDRTADLAALDLPGAGAARRARRRLAARAAGRDGACGSARDRVVLPGAAHSPAVETPEATAAALLRWLDAQA